MTDWAIINRIIMLGILLGSLMIAAVGCGGSGEEDALPTAIATFTPAPTLPPTPVPPTRVPTPTPLNTAPLTITEAISVGEVVTAAVVTTTTGEESLSTLSDQSATLTQSASISTTTEVSAATLPEPTTLPTELPTLAPPTEAPTAAPTAKPVAEGELSPSVAALLATANPANGQQLTVNKGCTACHSLDKGVRVVGPSWYRVGATASERVAGQSAEAYLYTSILHPNAYVVPEFLPNLMPANFGELITEPELADIIAYLLTLQGE